MVYFMEPLSGIQIATEENYENISQDSR